jgi:hypothetical protein
MPPTGFRIPLRLAAAALPGLAVPYAIRIGLMEVPPEADRCLDAPDGMACGIRAALWFATHFQAFGLAALALACLAWLVPAPRRQWPALAALLAALAALVLYNARFGAPATVLALLALADAGVFRPGARATP